MLIMTTEGGKRSMRQVVFGRWCPQQTTSVIEGGIASIDEQSI
jgi:hypothetical protein